VRGAALASLAGPELELIVVGDTARVGKVLSESRHDAERLRIHHAESAIRPGERAAEALAARPEASIAVAVDLVAQGEADAVISAGSSAAALLACRRSWRPLPGVRGVALSSVYPTEMRRGERDDPFALVLDVGARGDASAEDLVQYAVMGAVYAASVARNARPRVAVVGGGETGAVPREVERAGDLLLAQTGLNYVGAVEAIDIPRGIADVVVCSGHTGHAILTLLEGVNDTVVSLARYAYKDRLLWRAALGMVSSGVGRLKRLTDWQEYGGAPLLGYEHLLLRLLPSSGERAVANAIKVCARALGRQVTRDIGRRIAETGTVSRDQAAG
jgi:phosphate acyltransferase